MAAPTPPPVITVHQLSRSFRAYRKQPGLLGAIRGLIRREYDQIRAVQDISFEVQEGELVGLIFDGNIESLPGNIIFDDTVNRSVSVHSAGILEALEEIYKATRIAEELKTAKLAAPASN